MALTLGIGMRIAALSGAVLLTLENKPFMDDHIINAVVLVALMICARRRCSSTQDTWPDPRVIGGRYGVGLNDNALWPETMRVSRTAGSRGPWADYITTALAIIRETDPYPADTPHLPSASDTTHHRSHPESRRARQQPPSSVHHRSQAHPANVALDPTNTTTKLLVRPSGLSICLNGSRASWPYGDRS